MIPFNKPYLTGKETQYIEEAVKSGKISGNGIFTQKCQQFFESNYGFKKALLTTSCTDALEMAAILIDIKEGDEVIMPSYTFVSTANAFVLRGAKIVFVDIRPDTMNIDENLIEEAITDKTKAIIPVHYAGVSCEMDRILEIAKKYNLYVIEDAAQGVMSKYNGRALGAIGDFGTYSDVEGFTKNAFGDFMNAAGGVNGNITYDSDSINEKKDYMSMIKEFMQLQYDSNNLSGYLSYKELYDYINDRTER